MASTRLPNDAIMVSTRLPDDAIMASTRPPDDAIMASTRLLDDAMMASTRLPDDAIMHRHVFRMMPSWRRHVLRMNIRADPDLLCSRCSHSCSHILLNKSLARILMSCPALGGYESFYDVIKKYRYLKIYVFLVSARQNVIRLGVISGLTFHLCHTHVLNVQRMIPINATSLTLKCHFFVSWHLSELIQAFK